MKKTVRLFGILLISAIFAIFAIASGSSDDGNKKEISSGQNASNTTEAITIEEQVLLDRESVIITAKEYINDSFWGEGIKVLIENNSEKNLNISCNALIVNNYMITDLFYESVAAGKKTNATIYLSNSQLKAAGISNVGQVEMYFNVIDSDNYNTVFESDVVTIKTSAFDTMDTTAENVGSELYNANGIKIIGKYVDENSFWGAAALLCIENKSGQNITVSCEDVSINGFMVSSLFSSTVYNEKNAVDEITFLSSELEENGIESIENIELKFHIYNADTFNTIATTDVITINMN